MMKGYRKLRFTKFFFFEGLENFNYQGLGPGQIGVVDQKHPIIHREPTATLNNYNPRVDDKTNERMAPGQDL